MSLFVLVVLLPLASNGQLVVDDNPTAQQLVKNVLVGNGVQVSNVTYTGSPKQLGYFDATSANLMSIDSGLIMSSGEAEFAIGPNDQNDGSTGSPTGSVDGDPDLKDVNGNLDVNDISIIEFDFVPQGDTVEFDYVFGSEEYMTYANGSINDAFGFFISGPGISGPYTNNAKNIATIPGTNQAVTLNNVNATTNPSYYINNGDGDNVTPPPPNYDTDSAYIQYDGHTVVLTAKSAVKCDSTYHFKLAIADGSDDIIDSGVFLKANSLSSKAINIDENFDLGSNDSTIWEGCGKASFDIGREGDTSTADTVLVQKSGTATEGSDYTPLPDSLFFNPGQDSTNLSLSAIDDNIAEGKENVVIDLIYDDPSSCSIKDTATIEFWIDDPDTLQLTTSGDTSIGACTDSIKISASAKGGLGSYEWSWNKGLSNGDSSGFVSPNSTTTYLASVSDTCSINTPSDSITVNVPSYPALQIHPYNDTTFVCPNQSVPVGIDSISGGSGKTKFSWDSLGTDSSYMVNPASTSSYTVTAVDTCLNDSTKETITVSKGFTPLQVTAGRDTTICAGTQGNLSVSSYSGGTGNIDFDWGPGGYSGASTWYTSDTLEGTSGSSMYTVTAEDSCGVTDTDSMQVDLSTPIAKFETRSKVQETGSPIHFISRSLNAEQHFWDFGFEDYRSQASDTVLSYPEPGDHEVMLAVRDDIGCTDTTKERIRIDPPFDLYVPNAFTPDGDGINDIFRGHGAGIDSYHMQIFNRWGKMIYQTKKVNGGWDGTVDGEPAPTGVYVYKFTVKGENGETQNVKGHVNLIR